ncbi:branched-chain amino acid ABC transporter permease [Candidatus Woesearchaeota archaeon]|nr:branched-chain amino acid ABC transporter permease [Candidatus Woesearchaeota archaeon]
MGIAAQLIINGIIAGGIYALVALGYTMVYGILRFINFAHGEVFMLGAYLGWIFNIVLGVNVIVAFVLAMLGCAVAGYIIEKIAYKPLRGRGMLPPLITAIAISLFLQAMAILVFGAQIRTFRTGEVVRGITIPFIDAVITKIQIVIIVVSVALMVALHFYIKYTKTGKAMRAVADDYETASIVGINPNKVISYVFIIGSALAAAGGVLVGMEQNLTPTMGVSIGIKSFTAAVVGGIGNIYGALLGGFMIGLIENIGIWFIPSGYKDAIAFAVLLLFLLFKPTGIFGAKKEEGVRI